MFEPKYLPTLSENLNSLNNIRFDMVHDNKYRQHNDPDADPLHVHSYLEIFLNLSCDVSFLVNNKLYPVPIGSVVLSRPEDIHMGIFHSDGVQEHICIWIDADFDSPLFSFLRKDDFLPLFTFDEQTRKQFGTLAFSLLTSLDKEDAGLEKMCYLLQILMILKNKQTPCTEQAYIPQALQRIIDDIHINFSQIHNVNEILAKHFVSSATLTRWFRKYLHSSPREYLESVRLSNAAVLLSNGYSVTEACLRSGFSDCSRFIAVFKEKFGETPLKYKKMQI